MRIGITCYPTYGGSGILATELGMELAARGHQVHFISYAHPIRLDSGQQGVHYHEVEVASYPLFAYPPYCLSLAARMAEVAERYQLDLLHVHYAIPHAVSALLARQMSAPRRLPYVTTLHGTDITLVGLEPSLSAITRYSIEASDGVTAVSNFLKEQTCRVFHITRAIQPIHNFVNCDKYKPMEKPPGMKRLIHISNFRPVKRVLDCIRILHKVLEVVEVELWMVGDGPDRGPAERLAHELGITRHVQFLGKMDHIERLLPQADVLLLPSEHEAFGLAALEAMACGVPPVATRVGGLKELVTHEMDGFLENVGDIDAQSASVVRLLTDAKLYQQCSRAARGTATTRFCSTRIIPHYERYYQQVLEGA